MSSFARTTFSHAVYASFRPSYPNQLFQTVLGYYYGTQQLQPLKGCLLDLGCGHGLISRQLAPYFEAVHATDPSPGMVEQARRLTSDARISIRQAAAEDLSFLADDSVDLVVAGQAAHWFDFSRAWPELQRVVKKGGTLAFWGYKDYVLVGYPQTSAIFDKFIYGVEDVRPGMESMARYWEEPGRSILRDSYSAIEVPPSQWQNVRRVVGDPNRDAADVVDVPGEALWLRKTLKMGELEGYVRTYSSFNNWRTANPGKKSRAQGGKGDVVDLLFDEVVAAVPEWRSTGDNWKDVDVDAVWGTVILMAKRR